MHVANESRIAETRAYPIRSAASERTGDRIVTTGAEGPVHVLDSRNGQLIKTFDGHQLFARGAVFSADAKTILSWSDDNTARLWDLATGQEVRAPMEHAAPVTLALFGSAGTTIVTATAFEAPGSDTWTINVWLPTGTRAHRSFPTAARVLAAAVSPDNRTLTAIVANRALIRWDIQKNAKVSEITLPGPTELVAAAILADGRGYVVAYARGTAALLGPDGKNRAALDASKGSVLGISAHAPSGLIAIAGSDRTARLYDWETGDLVASLIGHTASVTGVSFGAADGTVLTSSADGTVRIWKPGRRVGALRTQGVSVLDISPDGTHAAMATPSSLEIVALNQGRPASFTWPADFATDRNILAMSFVDRGNRIMAINSVGARIILDPQTGAREVAAGRSELVAASIARDGSRLAVAPMGIPGTVIVTNLLTGATTELSGHHGIVDALAFSKDGARLAVGTQDGDARVWAVDERKVVIDCGVSRAPARGDAVWFHMTGQLLKTVALTEAGDKLAVGATNGLVGICTSASREPVTILRAQTAAVSSVAFAGDGPLVATAGVEGVSVWDIGAERQVDHFGKLVGHVAFVPNASRLVAAAGRFVDLTVAPGRLIDPAPSTIWDVTRLSQSLDQLSADACKSLLVRGADLFSAVEISQDRLIRDVWNKRSLCE
jgi:WD40 repeat protein